MSEPEVRAEQIRQIIARLRRPAGACLPDEAAVGYVLETLTPEETARVDAHLAACERCAAEMASLVERCADWQGTEGEPRLAAWRARARAAMRARPVPGHAVIHNVELPTQGLGHPPLEHGQVGSLRYHGLEDQDRNLVLRFEASGLNLIGWSVRLTAREFARNVELRQVGPDSVGAETTIEHTDRRQWPANTSLRLEMVRPDPAG